VKRLIPLLFLLAACEATSLPMPEVPSYGKADGGAVQSISSKLTLDARIFVHVRINYSPDWDGILDGARSATSTLQRAYWPASALACPRLWIWVSHDPSGSATWAFEQGYSMPATATAIGTSTMPDDRSGIWYSYLYCDYVFREGGGETWRNGIPVQSGDNWVGYGVQCPGTTTGPTALTNIVHIVVPAGSANQYNLHDIDGPANNKGLWQPVAKYGCGWAADAGWDSTQTLSATWCEAAQFGPPTCLPNSIVTRTRSW
jgi:hypothetical protein